jgi:hypothetical protein
MAVSFGNQILFIDNENNLLSTVAGDILCYSLYHLATEHKSLSLQEIIDVLQN